MKTYLHKLPQPIKTLAWLLAMLMLAAAGHAATPGELQNIIARFNASSDSELRMDLAYQGLKLYAPIKQKSSVDPNDREALCRMKRLVVMDAMDQSKMDVLVTAIGTTGHWFLQRKNFIVTDYDADDKDKIADLKYRGCYMEGLSDLDFVIMGRPANAFREKFYQVVENGRNGHAITRDDLEKLEICFILDEQIMEIDSGGDPRRFWMQLMHLEASSYHPEKYITKGGKALYGVEHLYDRGGAFEPGNGSIPLSFKQWANNGGHRIGPFIPHYVYGGCCDMDYFMSHASEKTAQERVKTVLQVAKYLGRQAWMLKNAQQNAQNLPDGLIVVDEDIKHLQYYTKRIDDFITKSMTDKVWNSPELFTRFKKDGVGLSGLVCASANELTLNLGYQLLEALEKNGSLSDEMAVMINEIVYDLETVHFKRYPVGRRPGWYQYTGYDVNEAHVPRPMDNTLEFLERFRKHKPRIQTILADAGMIPPDEPELAKAEIGPVEPPPIATVCIDKIARREQNVKPGDTIHFDIHCRLDGLLNSEKDFTLPWLTDQQLKDMKGLAVWSWYAALERIMIQHLMLTDMQNASAENQSKRAYVSPFELEILTEKLNECEESVAFYAELIGRPAPEEQTGRFPMATAGDVTLKTINDYLNALSELLGSTEKHLKTIDTYTNDTAVEVQQSLTKDTRLEPVSRKLTEVQLHTAAQLKKLESSRKGLALFKKRLDQVIGLSEGDHQTLAGIAEEMQNHLGELALNAEQSVHEAFRLQNLMADGMSDLRQCARTVTGDNFVMYEKINNQLDRFDQDKYDLFHTPLPELESRARWLRNGEWAAFGAKWAVQSYALIQQFQNEKASLSATALPRETENAVMALSACGKIIDTGADYIPIPVLRTVIKDYSKLLADAPRWATAFEEMLADRSQRLGLGIRHAVLPPAYDKLIYHDNQLDSLWYYESQGPLAKLNRLAIIGYPISDEAADDIGESPHDRFWLIWDKDDPQGFIELSGDLYEKASLFAAWWRRTNGEPIDPSSLYKLLTIGKIEGGWIYGDEVTAQSLEQNARQILRFEAQSRFLAAMTGKESFTPDELRKYYGMLHYAVRELAEHGFIMRNDDIHFVLEHVIITKTEETSWIFGGGDPPDSAEGIGHREYSRLIETEKDRLHQAVKKLIEQKLRLREQARREYWQNARNNEIEDGRFLPRPAGLTREQIKLEFKNTFMGPKINKTFTTQVSPSVNPLKYELSFAVPENADGKCCFVCQVSIAGCKGTDYELDTSFVIEKPEDDTALTEGDFPVKRLEMEDPVIDLVMDFSPCSPPPGARKIDSNWDGTPELWYDLNGEKVGPCRQWWDSERRILMEEACLRQNGMSWRKAYNKQGRLIYQANVDQSDEKPKKEIRYYDSGVVKEEYVHTGPANNRTMIRDVDYFDDGHKRHEMLGIAMGDTDRIEYAGEPRPTVYIERYWNTSAGHPISSEKVVRDDQERFSLFSSQGVPSSETNKEYHDNQRSQIRAEQVISFDETGNIKSETRTLSETDGTTRKIIRSYHENGRVADESQFADNLQLLETVWYATGQTKRQWNYDENGKRCQFRYWHNSGQLQLYIPLTDDMPTGDCKRWDKDGNLVEQVNYSGIFGYDVVVKAEHPLLEGLLGMYPIECN